jgi:hypothetical protein
MTLPRHRCKKCGEKFTRPIGTRRLYCFGCRPAAHTDGLVVVQATPVPEAEQVEKPLRNELRAAGLLDSSDAAALIILARQLDSGTLRGRDLAGIHKEFRDAKTRLLDAAPAEGPDELELLRTRRDRREPS